MDLVEIQHQLGESTSNLCFPRIESPQEISNYFDSVFKKIEGLIFSSQSVPTSLLISNTQYFPSSIIFKNYAGNFSFLCLNLGLSSFGATLGAAKFYTHTGSAVTPSKTLILSSVILPGELNQENAGRITIKGKLITQSFGGMLLHSQCYYALISNQCELLKPAYFIPKKPLNEQIFVSGKTNGYYFELDENSNTSRVTTYSNGVRDGKEYMGGPIQWNLGRRTVTVTEYSKGITNGVFLAYSTRVFSHWEINPMSDEEIYVDSRKPK